MSFEFLMPDAAVSDDRFSPVARTSMEGKARAAGARFEIRDGWSVAVGYSSAEQEAAACRESAGWADVSHLGKLELQAGEDDLRAIVARCADGAELELGHATRVNGSWWCPLTLNRLLVLSEPAALPALRDALRDAAADAAAPASLLDVSTVFGAITIVGPDAREVFARFSALDLRPQQTALHALRPGSIARQPAVLIREDQDRFLFLFGWGVGEYMWTVVADAAEHLGGRPVGLDALAAASPELQASSADQPEGSDDQPGEPATEEVASDA